MCTSCGRHTHEAIGLIMKNTLDMLGTIILSTRAALAGSSRRTISGGVLCLMVLNISPVQASQSIDLYKLYAHIQIVDSKEYNCLDSLWTYESNWNPLSKNKKSSAFGIPQLLKMTTTNPIEQIDLGLKYIKTRHKTACLALSYFKKKGHY